MNGGRSRTLRFERKETAAFLFTFSSRLRMAAAGFARLTSRGAMNATFFGNESLTTLFIVPEESVHLVPRESFPDLQLHRRQPQRRGFQPLDAPGQTIDPRRRPKLLFSNH